MSRLKQSHTHQAGNTQLGFTLIELVVTMVILGIIASMAAPRMGDQLATQRNKSTAYELYNALQESKSTAFIQRRDFSYTVADANRTSSSTIAQGTGAPATLTFTRESRVSNLVGDAVYKVCSANAGSSADGYAVTVTPTARIDIERVTCP